MDTFLLFAGVVMESMEATVFPVFHIFVRNLVSGKGKRKISY